MAVTGAQVLLGILDEAVGSYETNGESSKIGGAPDWLGCHTSLPHCKICQQILSFVTQIYCPLANSIYHRTLYIFACSNQTCWNQSESWCAVRVEQKDSSSSASKTKDKGGGTIDWGMDANDWGSSDENEDNVTEASATVTDWCAGVDDWGDEDNATSGTGDSKTESSVSNGDTAMDDALGQLQQMTVEDDSESDDSAPDIVPVSHCCVEDLPQLSDQTYMTSVLNDGSGNQLLETVKSEAVAEPSNAPAAIFDPFFISVIEETSGDSSSQLKHERNLLKEYSMKEGVDLRALLESAEMLTGGGGASDEKYEHSVARHGDLVFHKFMKQIARHPEQILRYSWGGKPLFIRAMKDITVPRCEICGELRQFELQLMPSLVHFLCTSNASLEFGTVLVYTCVNSCWDETATYRTEVVLVQPDPDQHLFKV